MNEMERWRKSPLCFVEECIKVTPTKQQSELLQSITKEKYITIRSGHGTGKDGCLSWLVLWFFMTQSGRVLVVGPTKGLLHIILAEMSKWLKQSTIPDDFLVCNRERLKLISTLKEVKIEVKDTSKTLILVNESSSVLDSILTLLEEFSKYSTSKFILVGCMPNNFNYFYNTHFSALSTWKKLQWDSSKTSLVSKSVIKAFAEKYGINSDFYRVRIEGNCANN